GSLAGRALLAHELAHVVQQARGGPGLPAPEVSPSAPHEREARAAAVAVAAGRPRAHVAGTTGVGLARQTLGHEIEVARDLIRHVLGQEHPVNDLIDIDAALQGIAREGGPHAEAALKELKKLEEAGWKGGQRATESARTLIGNLATNEANLRRAEANLLRAEANLNRIRERAAEVLESEGHPWPRGGPATQQQGLRGIANDRGANSNAAQEILNEWDRVNHELEAVRRELEAVRGAAP